MTHIDSFSGGLIRYCLILIVAGLMAVAAYHMGDAVAEGARAIAAEIAEMLS